MRTLNLEYFNPADIDRLYDAITDMRLNEDDFLFESKNPDRKFIHELLITYKPLQYNVTFEYLDGKEEKWYARYTPGPHGNKQQPWKADNKGPDFHHIENFFKSWLRTIKPHIDAINKNKIKNNPTPGGLIIDGNKGIDSLIENFITKNT